MVRIHVLLEEGEHLQMLVKQHEILAQLEKLVEELQIPVLHALQEILRMQVKPHVILEDQVFYQIISIGTISGNSASTCITCTAGTFANAGKIN